MLERPELSQLKNLGYQFSQPWEVVDIFEKKLASFFGSTYAVATDSCTHALELSLLLLNNPTVTVQVPVHTYMSVPMMLEKIRQPWQFYNTPWQNYYTLSPLPVIDAAFQWEPNSYVADSLMCISFQFKKHIAIGRGGAILTDNKEHYNRLQKMCRDGRDRTLLQEEDNVTEIGYHYYMTPEDAARGILLFDQQHNAPSLPRNWQNYKILSDYEVFKNRSVY